MGRRTLTNRVETLEKVVEDLRKEPGRIDSLEARTEMLEGQFVQFRNDIRLEFSAMHETIAVGFRRVDEELGGVRLEFGRVDEKFGKVHEEFARVHEEFGRVHEEFGRVHEEFAGVHEELGRVHEEFAKVREEIRQGDEETRRFMRVLHEDLVGRIAVLGEQFPRR